MNFNWKKIHSTNGEYGSLREGHTLTYISSLHALLLYGGAANPKFNDAYLYSIRQNIWSLKPTIGRKPVPRSNHSAIYDEQYDALLIYAGEAEKSRSLDDFHVLSLKNWEWRKLFLIDLPEPRHSHTMSVIILETSNQHNAIIFGGHSMPKGKLLNDVWVLKNLGKCFEDTNNPSKDATGCECVLQYTKGDNPPPRKGHQSAIIHKTMYVFGGEAAQTSPSFHMLTIYALSLDNFTWKKIEPRTKSLQAPLTQRSQFSLVRYGQDIIIFGGVEQGTAKMCPTDLIKFNCENFQTEKIRFKVTDTDVPSTRHSHCMCLQTTTLSKFKAFMVGGSENSLRPFDIYELSGDWEISQDTTREMNFTKQPKQIEQLEVQVIKEKHELNNLEKQYRLNQANIAVMESSRMRRLEEAESRKASGEETELLLTMIKNEQFLSKHLGLKAEVLQKFLKKIHEYVAELNQVYNKYGDEEPDVQQNKNKHIQSCLKLKETYLGLEKHSKRTSGIISQLRKQIVELNNEFHGFMETEIDEPN